MAESSDDAGDAGLRRIAFQASRHVRRVESVWAQTVSNPRKPILLDSMPRI